MPRQQTVEVRLAFSFDCAQCGQENFVNSVMHEFTPAEQAEYAEELGERPQTGSWLTHPDHVTCQSCGAEFRAVQPGELVDEKA